MQEEIRKLIDKHGIYWVLRAVAQALREKLDKKEPVYEVGIFELDRGHLARTIDRLREICSGFRDSIGNYF